MRGVIYYAVNNRRFLKLASQSARSLKRHMPQLSVSLYTDLDLPGGHCFDIVKRLPQVSPVLRANQMSAMLQTHYDSFVLLDADTWVCRPFDEIFDLVEDPRVDLAATVVSDRPSREKQFGAIYTKAGVPGSFPFFSSVFLAVQRNPRTTAFLEEWESHYLRLAETWSGPQCQNEPPMRVALYRSDVRIMPLPKAYAFGRHGVLTRAASVIHWKGGQDELKRVERNVNKGAGRTRIIYHGKEHLYL